MPYGKPPVPPDPRFAPPPMPTETLLRSRTAEVLAVLDGRYTGVCLYGSLARDEAVAGSDIDLAATAVPGLDPW